MTEEEKFNELSQIISRLRAQLNESMGALEQIKRTAIPEGRVYAAAVAEKALERCRILDKEYFRDPSRKARHKN